MSVRGLAAASGAIAALVLAAGAGAADAPERYRAKLTLTLETSWSYDKDEGTTGECRASTSGDGGWTITLRGTAVTARPRAATVRLTGHALRHGHYTRTRCTSPTSATSTDGDCFGSRTPISRASARIMPLTGGRIRLGALRHPIGRSRLWCLPADVEIPSRGRSVVESARVRVPLRELAAGLRVTLRATWGRDRRLTSVDGAAWTFAESARWRLELVRVR